MENVMKMTKGVRALAILVLLLVVPAGEVAFGHDDGGWYLGFEQPGCSGRAYINTSSMAAIHSEAASGRLLSYLAGGICYTASAGP